MLVATVKAAEGRLYRRGAMPTVVRLRAVDKALEGLPAQARQPGTFVGKVDLGPQHES